MAYRRESFSSTSSSSSFPSSITSTSLSRSASTKRRIQRQGPRLKRWLSSHLLRETPIPESDSDPDEVKRYSISSGSHPRSRSRSPTASASSPKPKRHMNNYAGDAYNDNYNLHNIRIESGDTRVDALSDSYAAYCRAFSSSPPPDHDLHSGQRALKPLPRLPASTFAEELSTSNVEVDGDKTAEAGTGIRFLPVGAHGYHPASWALPRPPTPPPGILTPRRYEELQRRRTEKKNDGGGRRWLTWCPPIRASWLSSLSWHRNLT
ncbi:uncharacterized protein BJX67DRAFT_377564 [Aspergillus lucknowensis]|uniref:Uncharacterized protein n=1 Tax=Aspergillus lucknowensis TaxID=176173 RepID=A0ABR4M339_9EURO